MAIFKIVRLKGELVIEHGPHFMEHSFSLNPLGEAEMFYEILTEGQLRQKLEQAGEFGSMDWQYALSQLREAKRLLQRGVVTLRHFPRKRYSLTALLNNPLPSFKKRNIDLFCLAVK